MARQDYPHLEHLLTAYLHQDFTVVSGSFEGAVRDFLQAEPDPAAAGLRGDVARFVREHAGRIATSFEKIFPDTFVIGRTEEEARDWFGRLESLLRT